MDGEATLTKEQPEAGRFGAGSVPGTPLAVISSRRDRWKSLLRGEYGALALIALVGLALRLWGLSSKSLWIDETFSIGMVSQGWVSFAHTILFVQPNMELFYLLLKLASSITPAAWQHGEFFWRLLPALAGALTVVAIYPMARRLFGVRVALLAAALVATNEFLIEYSQQARGYTLFVLIFTLSFLALVRWLEGNRHAIIWFGVLSALGFLTQAFEVVFLVGQLAFVAIVASRGRAVRWRALALALAPVALVVLVRYPIYAAHPDQVAWIQRPTLNDLYVGAIQLSGGTGGTPSRYALPILLATVAAALFLIGYALALAARRPWITPFQSIAWKGKLDIVEAVALVICWVVIPVFGTWLGSQMKPIWVPRYLAPVSAGISLALAAALGLGVDLIPHVLARRVVFAGIAIMALFVWFVPVAHYQARAGWEDWRASARFVDDHFQPADGIVCYDNQWGCDFGFSHYFADMGGPAHFDPAAPGVFSWHTYSLGDREQIFASAVAPSSLAPYLARHRRLWVLLGHYTAGQGDWSAGLAWLDLHAHLVNKTVFTGDIEVYLYDSGGN
jgi:4-amino-4-deoxy-L-arabinose transferase-like glycosyltransferase